MHRGMWTALVMVVCLGSLGHAQGGLDLVNIVKVLDELKGQLQSLQQSFADQATQINGLNQQVGALTQRWAGVQQFVEKVPGLEAQLAPLLEQWPVLEGMAQTFGSLQGQLSEQLQKLGQLQQAVAGLSASGGDPRLDALQSEVANLQRDLQETRADKQTLQARLDSMQWWIWVALGGVGLLLLLQGARWLRRAPRPVS